MIGPVVVFSLVISALWAGSLFFHPQARCTRCTGGTPHFGSFLTGSSGLCRRCRGTGWRERPGVGALRTLGWDIGPTGRLQRRGEPEAGTDRRPRLGPQSACTVMAPACSTSPVRSSWRPQTLGCSSSPTASLPPRVPTRKLVPGAAGGGLAWTVLQAARPTSAAPASHLSVRDYACQSGLWPVPLPASADRRR